MFVSINTYFERIHHTLEHVVAPEIESDYARGQVSAVIGLLGELSKKIEFRIDLIHEEINMNIKILVKIIKILKDNKIPVPDNSESFIREIKCNGQYNNLQYIDKANDIFHKTIDLFNTNRDKVEPALFEKMDELIREHITKISMRDLGFLNPMSFDII